jgi:hypothetical protein
MLSSSWLPSWLGLDGRMRPPLHDHTNRESRGNVGLIPVGQWSAVRLLTRGVILEALTNNY